ncbi:MAG: glycosyltransferase [Calditrichaeota bacterium]|nr:glycosyltransferase [Calditrichota bacterium]
MATPSDFRKSPFDILKQRRDELFAARPNRTNAYLGLTAEIPSGLVEQVLKHTKKNSRLLVIGNGRSDALKKFVEQGFAVKLIDWSPLALAATEDVRRTLTRTDAEKIKAQLIEGSKLTCADGSCDGIVLTGILSELAHPLPLLKECSRVLSDGGSLTVCVPNNLASYHSEHATLWTEETLREMFTLLFDSVTISAQGDSLCVYASNKVTVKHPVIFAMMNIRNEDRWLRDVLDSSATICDGIIVYDDGSTDKTPEICMVHPAVVAYQRREETQTDKARDKNRMWEMALDYKFDWMLAIDGDELLEPTAPNRILDEIKKCPKHVTQIDFEFLYLWNDYTHYRTDGIYTGIYHPCLFRPTTQKWTELQFQATAHAGNLHCERVPQNIAGDRMRADIKIEHLGYMFAEDRLRKYHWNKNKDVKHANEGYYEHLLDQPHMTLAPWDRRPNSIQRGNTNVEKQTLKPDYYYANARRNLAERVPKDAREVLDVGCGNGATGKLIQQLTGARVTGIEIHPEVAKVARQVLADVHVLDVEADELPFSQKQFDCILCGDVLEHLIDPWKALQKLVSHLKPTGCLIVSLPNVRNLGVIGQLLEGSWNYQEYGILDSTHLRFFAKSDMEKLFASAGLRAELVETVRDPLYEGQVKSLPTEPLTLDLGGLVLRDVSPQDFNELTAQQFIFMAKPDASVLPKQKPVASVVIPVFNNLSYTKACLTSLFNTKEETPFEIIVVDDGSTDGTKEYLASLGNKINVVTHEQNYGFARSCNDGARASTGQLVVFLNNDTEVTPNWLDAMVKAVSEDRSIGIVGNMQIYPNSNTIQQAGIVCDANATVHSIYNNQLAIDHPAVNKPRAFQFIAGSCLMIWRQLFMEVGGFDEAYVNSCEDIDLCMKVTQTRRKVWYCPESKIYHHESKTVNGHNKSGANYQRLLSRWKDLMLDDADSYYLEDGFMRLADGRVVPLDKPEENRSMTTDTRIALLTTYHQRCGLATYAEKLCDAMTDLGETVLVLAEKSTDLTAADLPNVIRCWTRETDGGKDIVPTLLANKIQVLHINHGGIFPLGGWLLDVVKQARAHNIRIVTMFHTTETIDETLGEIARHSDACRVHHPQNAVELVALGAPPDRVKVMPHPVPTPEFTDLAEAKLALEWDPAQKVVATFGMVDPHKGLLELIEAMPAIHEHTQAKLLIMGAPHPASKTGREYLVQCMNRVNELNMQNQIKFLSEFVPDREMMATLQACDVIVLNHQSMRFESSGCMAHAIASGRPTVTSSSPAFDVALPVTMRVTKDFDLVQSIVRALRNPFLARMLKDATIEYAEENCWLNAAESYLSCYEAVLSTEPACTTDLMKFYATHPDDIYTERLQRERVRWLAEKSAGAGRILEVGPANGYVINFCKGHEAVDIYRERIDVARALRPGITFRFANVTKGLPQGDKSFDIVMSPEIFEHVEWEMAVTALKECMRVGKRVLITIPNADKPNYNPDLVHNPEHRWLVTRQLVDGWLKAAGAIDYELDCSDELDFYLIDINSEATSANIRVTPRAEKLPHFVVTPGPRMTVAIDAEMLTHDHLLASDAGRYFLELLNNLREVRPEWTIQLVTSRTDVLKQKLAAAGVADAYHLTAWRELARSGAQALFVPNPHAEHAADSMRAAREAGMIVTCAMNDLIPLAYPQFYLTHDPMVRERYVGSLNAIKEYCDISYCSTQATLQEMQIRLGTQLKNLRVIHGGPTLSKELAGANYENVELQKLANEQAPFFLHTGELAPVKNLRTILFAVEELRKTVNSAIKIVLACNLNEKAAEQIRSAVTRDGLDPSMMVIPMNLSEADLTKLYVDTVAFLNPSLMEGLSLSLVNAMSLGTPVIASKQLAQEETCGDAAVYVKAENSQKLAAAAKDILLNPERRHELSQASLAEARKFDWRRSAEKLAVYLTEQIVKTDRKPSHTMSKQFA